MIFGPRASRPLRAMAQPKGWHSRGYLPHFDSPETIQFITFRLAGSLPSHVHLGSKPLTDDALYNLDESLDGGLGECWLDRPEIAILVEEALMHFDPGRYRLLAWCIMPNHVHVLIEIPGRHSLSSIVGSWKSFTAKRANTLLNRTGAFWHADYFDRYMRNEEQLERTVAYIENNPVKAKLAEAPSDWPWSSARFAKSR